MHCDRGTSGQLSPQLQTGFLGLAGGLVNLCLEGFNFGCHLVLGIDGLVVFLVFLQRDGLQGSCLFLEGDKDSLDALNELFLFLNIRLAAATSAAVG